MTDFLDRWAAKSEESVRLALQERLIAEVTEEIWKVMEEAGINKTQLADRMGATRGYISQVLNGSRNMTLRTLSDICFALGRTPVIGLGEAEAQSTVSGIKPGEVVETAATSPDRKDNSESGITGPSRPK
jgi:transcriptional regulator with XRE-family HTH domain